MVRYRPEAGGATLRTPNLTPGNSCAIRPTAGCGDCVEMQVDVGAAPYYPSMELRYRLVLAALFVALVGLMVFLYTYTPPGPSVD